MEQTSQPFTRCADKDYFRTLIRNTIATDCCTLLAVKPDDKKYLNHTEFCHVCDHISEVFRLQFGCMRNEVEGALSMCKAITAPMSEKSELLKNAAVALGGTAGVGAIVTGIGLALGWGSGIITSVITFFAGTSILGPVAWITAGVTLALIAGYMAFGSDEAKASERAINALKESMDKVIDQIWA